MLKLPDQPVDALAWAAELLSLLTTTTPLGVADIADARGWLGRGRLDGRGFETNH